MDQNNPEPSQTNAPKWLKKVQENSWEPEILLSGFVLIGLLQLPDKIRYYSDIILAETFTWNIANIFISLQLVVYILIFGLIVHLFLRSIWVGLIGMTYAFPKGIQKDRLNYQPRFMKQVEQISSLENQIIYLEKLCSSIFATCFFLMMLIFGLIISIVLFLLGIFSLYFLLNQLEWSYTSVIDMNFDNLFTVILVVIVIDFITVGIYRKNKYVAKFYYPIHRVIGWITFSRFYRSIYYVLGTNIKKGYLAAFFVIFFVFVILGQTSLHKPIDAKRLSFIQFYGRSPETNFFSPYYADRNEAWRSSRMTIPSPIVSGRFLEIKIKHLLQAERYMYTKCNLTPEEIQGIGTDAIKIDCVNKVYRIYLNDQEIDNPDWMFYFNQEEGRKGYITFLDVELLEPGRHHLEVKFHSIGEEERFARLMFLKE